MDVSSKGIVDGRILDKYGCNGTEFGAGDMPIVSLPFKIEGAPSGTASFAVIFDDPDAIPVGGIRWVHWLISGLRDTELPEDASRTRTDLVQGVNDWYTRGVDDRDTASCYAGPYPPDKDHTYVLTVLALDFVPVLRTGFTREELLKVTKDHVLAKATLKGKYSPRRQ